MGRAFFPQQVQKRNAPSEVYLWSYSTERIVAKIENATIGQVKAAYPQYESLGVLDTPTAEAIGRLKNLRIQLPLARVTIYLYDKLVGMTECIKPDGTSIYYEYDSFNRLKCIKDHSGYIIKQYDYGYRQ